MKHIEIVKRSWRTMLQYRALWFFGVILALTTVSGAGAWGGGRGNGHEYQQPQTSYVTPGEDVSHDWNEAMQKGNAEFEQGMAEFNRELAEGIPADVRSTIVTIAIVAAVILLILVIVCTIARYVSETSLIRMVDDYEETESQKSVREGWKMGWSRTAWKLFLIDLLIDIPVGLAFLVLFLVAAAPLLLWTTGDIAAGIVGAVTTSGFFFVLIVLAVVVAEVLRLLKTFARRTCALDEQGVLASIGKGYTLARGHLKDVGLMWLVTVAIRFAWSIAAVCVGFLLIMAAILVGGLLTLIVGGIATLATVSTTAWIIGGVTGGVIFVLVLALPLVLFEGMREVLLSSTWTLTYRQLRTMQVPEPAPLPQVGPQAEQAAA
jgi:hypothetical protein